MRRSAQALHFTESCDPRVAKVCGDFFRYDRGFPATVTQVFHAMFDSAHFDDFDRVWSQRDLSRAIGWKRLKSWDSSARTLRAIFEARPEFCHSGGTIAQGGFITAWLDASMAQAIMRDTQFQSNIATLELKVSFLKAVPPGEVLAEGRVLRRGKRVVFLEGSLFNLDGTELLATATSTGLIVPLVLDKE